MTDHVLYRTTDMTRWGLGLGADLSAAQIDINFWVLYSAITALQDHALTNENQIDFFSVVKDQMFITMMNHQVFGPFQLPVAQWNFQGEWLPTTAYSVMDVVTYAGAVYLVLFAHTSAPTFVPDANDGAGHNFYGLLLQQPSNQLPVGGFIGQRLAVSVAGGGNVPTSVWEYDKRNIGVYVQGKYDSNEVIIQYAIPEACTLPSGLVGSSFFANTPSVTVSPTPIFTVCKNGNPIGTIAWPVSDQDGSITFTADVDFVADDILTLIAPAVVDADLADISFTFAANLTS